MPAPGTEFQKPEDVRDQELGEEELVAIQSLLSDWLFKKGKLKSSNVATTGN